MGSRIRDFFVWIINRIRESFIILIIIVLVVIGIVVAAIIIANRDDNTTNENENPEVAQIFEPSIGTPLPPDTNTDQPEGDVAGITTEQSNDQPKQETTFVAPNAGVDPSKPIPYQNSKYGFSITVPAYTNIAEQDNLITFGNLFYVNIMTSSDNLDQISKQLSQSPDIKNIQAATLNGKQALKFSLNNNTGYALTMNNKVYYLIGQDKYLSQIKF